EPAATASTACRSSVRLPAGSATTFGGGDFPAASAPSFASAGLAAACEVSPGGGAATGAAASSAAAVAEFAEFAEAALASGAPSFRAARPPSAAALADPLPAGATTFAGGGASSG